MKEEGGEDEEGPTEPEAEEQRRGDPAEARELQEPLSALLPEGRGLGDLDEVGSGQQIAEPGDADLFVVFIVMVINATPFIFMVMVLSASSKVCPATGLEGNSIKELETSISTPSIPAICSEGNILLISI